MNIKLSFCVIKYYAVHFGKVTKLLNTNAVKPDF